MRIAKMKVFLVEQLQFLAIFWPYLVFGGVICFFEALKRF
jgi:hypothetical protein